MKLTIKKKQTKDQNKKIDNSSASSINNIDLQCCHLNNEGERYIFVRPQSKQLKSLHELIKLDSVYTYSKVSSNLKQNELQSTILKTLSNNQVRYQPWIGYLCAHCCQHYSQFGQRMTVINEFVEKFRAAFESQKCSSSILQQNIKRLVKYCQQSILSPSEQCIGLVCRKYQQTLLLEFIPVQYSDFIIKKYLSNDGDIQQYVRICTSVAHFVLNTVKPTSQQHFLNIMYRPFMGTVQWPVVIANRHMFESEPVNLPFVENM